MHTAPTAGNEPKTRVERILEYTRSLVRTEAATRAKEVIEHLLQDDRTFDLRQYILAMREDEREHLINLIKDEIERTKKLVEEEKLRQNFLQDSPE